MSQVNACTFFLEGRIVLIQLNRYYNFTLISRQAVLHLNKLTALPNIHALNYKKQVFQRRQKLKNSLKNKHTFLKILLERRNFMFILHTFIYFTVKEIVKISV